MKKSVWTDSVELPSFDSLNGNVKTDVLIIGGGLCGLLCAYFLQQAGVDYILVEADKIASGMLLLTTAKYALAKLLSLRISRLSTSMAAIF